jgi:hypothetical protein
MTIPAFADLYRLGATQSVALNSAAGAGVSCAAFGTQTYAVYLAWTGSPSSTGGVLIKVIDPTSSAVDSTTGTLIPSTKPAATIKVSPHQQISAISADAATPVLRITELTK